MQKLALFLCSLSLMGGLCSSAIISAKTTKQAQSNSVEAQVTPQAWDQQSFSSLTSEHKKVVIGILQTIQKSFQSTHDAIDKGVDTFMKSYGQIVQFYSQVVNTLTPRLDTYGTMMPIIKALAIVPSVDDSWEPVTRSLPENGQMTEQEFKRILNKVFRNKDTKAEIKSILKKQCADIDIYVAYINKEYAQEVAELAALEEQMNELIAQLQAQQDQ